MKRDPRRRDRTFLTAATALLLATMLLLPWMAGRACAQAIWFDALGDQPLELSDDEATTLMRGVRARLTDTEAPAELPAALVRDAQPRIVFISASDGLRTATVGCGAGFGVLAAASEAADRVAEQMPGAARTRWLKLDLVHSTHPESIRPNDRLNIDPTLEGLAFDHVTQVALLPEQLGARKLVTDEIHWGRLFEATADVKQREALRKLEQGRSIACYPFTTQSFYLDGNRAVPLFRGHRRFDEVDAATVREAAIAAGAYLARVVEPDGAFVYEIDPGTGFVSGEYNMLRHAGTTYAMLELYELTRDPQLLSAAQRALAFMLKSIRPLTFKDETVAGMVSEDGEIKLGGNALPILAIVQYSRTTADSAHVETARKLGRWIELTQDERGQFTVHKQDPQTLQSGSWESEYYPGEALLALGRLASIDPDGAHWLDSAEKAARFLINVRDGHLKDDELAHDHWLLYGLAELYPHRREPQFVAHAGRIARSIVSQQERDSNVLDWRGGWPRPPRSNPTATRLEGLCATHRLFLAADQREEATRLLPAIRAGILFELQLQNRPENVMYHLDPTRALGGIRRNLTDNEVRIDDVQHCLSALLGYYRILSTGQN